MAAGSWCDRETDEIDSNHQKQAIACSCGTVSAWFEALALNETMTKTRTNGQRTLRLLLVGAIVAVIVIAACNRLKPDHRADAFVTHWAGLFRKCPDLASIRTLPPKERPDCVYIRQFPNGQWVAVKMEHSCCSGAGFDASVFLDSTRIIRYDKTYSFCGYEGLCGELEKVQATELDGFYASLTNLNLNIWKQEWGQPRFEGLSPVPAELSQP